MPGTNGLWEVVVIGGGIAGLSAAIYLGRAKRRTLIVDAGQSLARWEPDVQNYLGFVDSISGEDLLRRGREHALRYGVQSVQDEILDAGRDGENFVLYGKESEYRARRVLMATGLFHLPPEIPHVSECLGHSMFFCKDCDGWRVQGKRVAVAGHNDEAVEYALGMLLYSPCVVIATNGKPPVWGKQHAQWLREYEIPVFEARITDVQRDCQLVQELVFDDRQRVLIDALFTTRGDIFHNRIAKDLGAEVDAEGQIKVNELMRTSVGGLYAAGCVTPANCQMIIAAGEGATAAQAINRDLFEESLRTHRLRRFRQEQILHEQTEPEVKAR